MTTKYLKLTTDTASIGLHVSASLISRPPCLYFTSTGGQAMCLALQATIALNSRIV